MVAGVIDRAPRRRFGQQTAWAARRGRS